jgi:hypothetical protein
MILVAHRLVALHNVTSREKAGFVSLVKSLIHGWLKMVMTTSAGRLNQWGEIVIKGAFYRSKIIFGHFKIIIG